MPRSYPEARKWYGTKEWRAIRKVTLYEHPICVRCGLQKATTVNHKIPHKGNYDLFFAIGGCNSFEGVCKSCHDSHIARMENGRIDTACNQDGYPVDKNHPWNTPR